jgi:hypothetical protein
MRRRLVRVDAALVQALIAAALSFAHLHDVAGSAGQSGWKGWAYPISVDLLMVAAWRRLRANSSARLAWAWFLVALTASLGANVATAGFLDLHHAPAWLRMLVAGWPAAAFLGGTLLAHDGTPPTPATSTPEAAPAEAAPDEEPPVYVDAPDWPELPEPATAAPELPTAESLPPATPVPAPLLAHARKVAADHHARTGTEIDTDTLRARLGVPAPLVTAIAAQL